MFVYFLEDTIQAILMFMIVDSKVYSMNYFIIFLAVGLMILCFRKNSIAMFFLMFSVQIFNFYQWIAFDSVEFEK